MVSGAAYVRKERTEPRYSNPNEAVISPAVSKLRRALCGRLVSIIAAMERARRELKVEGTGQIAGARAYVRIKTVENTSWQESYSPCLHAHGR